MTHTLYQIHTRLFLHNLSQIQGRPVTLDDIPDGELSRLSGLGFDWLYLLGVWQTGPLGQQLARSNQALRQEIAQILPDSGEQDICSSCFAITGYQVPAEWGGDAALQRLRQRLNQHGLRLMLDFIPNHTATDHPWAQQHPEYYVQGSAPLFKQSPRNYLKLPSESGTHFLAHGRDPYFPPWSDTLQLNYAQPALQAAMSDELLKTAALCDGLRCDMAMLVTPEIFERTWNLTCAPFWPAAIARVKGSWPDFTFLAEVYWDLEADLLQQGFDFAYDKRLYDNLRNLHAHPVREYLSADPEYQFHLARFLENHDEQRAAKIFPPGLHQAAAVITFFAPGLRFFQQGQLEGYQLRLPVQLCRLPHESPDSQLQSFYQQLLAALPVSEAQPATWQLLKPIPAWEGNWTWDGFIGYTWLSAAGARWLAVINFSPHKSQCYFSLPLPELRSRQCRLRDWFSQAVYDRPGDELLDKGLYLDLAAWSYNLFEITISP
jgi:glycosidase